MVNGSRMNDECYDLLGRKQAKPKGKGINIISGKKIVFHE
jgi:hypothetical protein